MFSQRLRRGNMEMFRLARTTRVFERGCSGVTGSRSSRLDQQHLTTHRQLQSARWDVSGAQSQMFVGRHDARATLQSLWSEVTTQQQAALVSIEGPPGFGKSHLMRHFNSEVDASLSLHAQGEQDEQHLEFGILHQLLRRLEVPKSSILSTLHVGTGIDQDPLAVGSAIIELFDKWAVDGLLLTIDDIHLGDTDSLRALVFALRRLTRVPILTVISHDTGGASRLPSPLARFIADSATRVVLPPLDAGDVVELAKHHGFADVSRSVIDRLVSVSGGSPLIISALLDELDVVDLNDARFPLRAPSTYAELVEDRLAQCSEEAVAFVHAAAILADGNTAVLIAQIAQVDLWNAALDECVEAGLLEVVGVNVIRFVHPMTRSSVFHQISSQNRAALHLRAAGLLASIDSIRALEHRVAASPGVNDDLAQQLIDQADVDRSVNAWVAAAERYRMAIELSSPDSDVRQEATLGLVDSLALEGDHLLLGRARSTVEAFEVSALRSYALGRIRGMTGAWTDAEVRFAEAWDLFEADSPTTLGARICGEAARCAIVGGRGTQALEWLTSAMGFANIEPSTQNDLMALWALAMGISGRASEALAALEGFGEPSSNPNSAELDMLSGRGALRVWQGDLAKARDDLLLVVQSTRSRGPIHSMLYASQFLADVSYRLGKWDEAIVTAEDAVAIARDSGDKWALPMLHAVASFPQSARGNFDEATEHVIAARAAIVSSGDISNRVYVAMAAARLAFAQRDHDAVIDALKHLAAMSHLDGVREPGVQPWQPLLAWAFTMSGEVDKAGTLLDEVQDIIDHEDLPSVDLALARERARLLAGQDPEAALGVLDAASSLADRISDRVFDRARFDLLRGHLLRRNGRSKEAVASLQAARERLAALGAKPWISDTERELALCGVDLGAESRVRPSAFALLTPHESRVANLVIDGMTNRQIAAELVVSVKTVGYHLGNIYMKLGVHSRVQMVKALAGAEA